MGITFTSFNLIWNFTGCLWSGRSQPVYSVVIVVVFIAVTVVVVVVFKAVTVVVVVTVFIAVTVIVAVTVVGIIFP